MENFKKLYHPYLDKLAQDLNIDFGKKTLKDDKIKIILDSNISEKKLSNMVSVLYKEQNNQKGQKAKKKHIPKSSTAIETRFNLIEEQIKFIMSKLTQIESRLAKNIPKKAKMSKNLMNKIKDIIKSELSPGQKISIDKLLKIKKFENISKSNIGRAIEELIDEEVLDCSEGKSIQKIGKNIAILIRR